MFFSRTRVSSLMEWCCSQVRAAGCSALGMLGGGFMPPPPPPDAQTGLVNVQPKWTFDKDLVARNALKKRAEALSSTSAASLSAEVSSTTASLTTAGGGGGGSSSSIMSPGANTTAQVSEAPSSAVLPHMTADGESVSGRALDLACPDLASRLLDLARMDPSPEVKK